jgi:hypothetical protein
MPSIRVIFAMKKRTNDTSSKKRLYFEAKRQADSTGANERDSETNRVGKTGCHLSGALNRRSKESSQS